MSVVNSGTVSDTDWESTIITPAGLKLIVDQAVTQERERCVSALKLSGGNILKALNVIRRGAA